MPIIPAIQETEIRKIASPGRKVNETPISTNRPGMVVCICNPRHIGDIRRRNEVPGQPQATSTRSCLEKKNN
jgi:hypothetical protein